MDPSITSTEGNAARGVGADAEHATDAARSDSRLVIRDERCRPGVTPTAAESPVPDSFKDFEAELYRFEARGDSAELIAHPIPRIGTDGSVAHIDWLAFTVFAHEREAFAWIADELQEVFGFATITSRKTGLYGYTESAIIVDGGLVAWGGKNQRNTVYVSLNAVGCATITSWWSIHDWCLSHNARLTRIDLAHDDLVGESMTIEKGHALWESGGFNAGGRRPTAHPAGDWWGLVKGRTVYIGDRLNGKLLRIYEKGKQLGDPDSLWVRIELELHNKNRTLPLDMLLKPGAYLAGAYPCLGYLSAEQCKVRTTRKAASISLERATEIVKQQYGKLFNLLLQVHGGDYAAVVLAVAREGLPARFEQYAHSLRDDPGLMDELARVASHEAADAT